MKKAVKVVLAILVLVTLAKVPLLYIDWHDERIRFSLSDSIEMDIDEQYFCTPYIIKDMIIGTVKY